MGRNIMVQYIKNKNANAWKVVYQNCIGNTSKHLRVGKVTASQENQLSKTVDPNFTWQDVEQKWLEQGKKCGWLKVRLDPEDVFIKNHPLAPSIDRVDTTKPYSYDNVIVSCRLVNLGRGRYDDEEFGKLLNERFIPDIIQGYAHLWNEKTSAQKKEIIGLREETSQVGV